MKPIYVGENQENKKIYIDLEKDDLHFILLCGATGSGKSIFHLNLYKQLIENNSADEIGIIALDFTQVDLFDWTGPYLIGNPTYDKNKSFKILEDLVKSPNLYGNKKIFVHIEENELAIQDEERFMNAIKNIKKYNKNVYIIYSTSRPGVMHFYDFGDDIDLKVVFGLISASDSYLLLGNDIASTFGGGYKILAFHNKQILSKPLTEQEVDEAKKFGLKMGGN